MKCTKGQLKGACLGTWAVLNLAAMNPQMLIVSTMVAIFAYYAVLENQNESNH